MDRGPSGPHITCATNRKQRVDMQRHVETGQVTSPKVHSSKATEARDYQSHSLRVRAWGDNQIRVQNCRLHRSQNLLLQRRASTRSPAPSAGRDEALVPFVPFVHSINGSTVPPTVAATDSLEWIGDPWSTQYVCYQPEAKGGHAKACGDRAVGTGRALHAVGGPHEECTHDGVRTM